MTTGQASGRRRVALRHAQFDLTNRARVRAGRTCLSCPKLHSSTRAIVVTTRSDARNPHGTPLSQIFFPFHLAYRRLGSYAVTVLAGVTHVTAWRDPGHSYRADAPK